MTSVTLPSSSGPIHGSYSTNVTENDIDESTFERPRPVKRCLVTAATASVTSDSYKKRRKQATPVRISAADSELEASQSSSITNVNVNANANTTCTTPQPVLNLGDLSSGGSVSPDTSGCGPPPAPTCPLCDISFASADGLHAHMSTEHASFVLKKEMEESTGLITAGFQTVSDSARLKNGGALTPATGPGDNSLPWMPDLSASSRDWINPNLMPFTPVGGPSSMYMGLPFGQPPAAESIVSRQPIRIFNPDAYCELCNKEFCNKYFLKTHKANKHGIYTDPPASEAPIPASVSIPSYVSNKLPTTPVPSIDVMSVKTEPKLLANLVSPYPDLYQNPFAAAKLCPTIITKISTSGGSISEHEPVDTVPISVSSDSFPPNGEVDRNHTTTTTTMDDTSNESSSPKVQIESTSSLKKEIGGMTAMTQATISYTTPPGKVSPGQQLREIEYNNRLRRIGVMNPKAFCEICCKEYCNKYFLRTHKMKRHGIYIPDDRDSKSDSLLQWSQNNTQTSPLNLIMGEQSNMSDRKTSSPSDISCDLCGIKFQNISLMQLHNLSVHGKVTQQEGQQDIYSSTTDEKKSADNDKMIDDKISEDLQKLQSMILQLNELDVNTISSSCTVCSKEFENRYYLHAHMMTDHGLLLDDTNEMEKHPEIEGSINNNTICDLCGRDFQNYDELKAHMTEMHSSNQTVEVKEEFNGFTTPDKSIPRTGATAISATSATSDKRVPMSLAPTSSYCEICNKELCNKYFMKTHMQRMHGIEIENGAQIGGVICDICNKELCSKYFLRVHKHNTHGIVEYGTSLLQPRIKTEEYPPTNIPTETDQALKPADLADLSHRYFTHFTEVCTICSRRFRSTKWLKTHLLSDHGQVGAEKWAEIEQQLQQSMSQQNKHTNITNKQTQGERISPALKIPSGSTSQDTLQKVGIQNVLSSIFGADESNNKIYHCSYCPFSTPILPFLFVHERSHSANTSLETDSTVPLKCPVCNQTFAQPDQLQHHMFTLHPFFPLPPFYNGGGGGTTDAPGETSKEPSECADECEDANRPVAVKSKQLKVKRKMLRTDLLSLPLETDQSLKEMAKRMNLPATYALPQVGDSSVKDDSSAVPGTSTSASTSPHPYIMQAFLLEETTLPSLTTTTTATTTAENRVVPSIVFLPVLQKVSAPLTTTFTLTPA